MDGTRRGDALCTTATVHGGTNSDECGIDENRENSTWHYPMKEGERGGQKGGRGGAVSPFTSPGTTLNPWAPAPGHSLACLTPIFSHVG